MTQEVHPLVPSEPPLEVWAVPVEPIPALDLVGGPVPPAANGSVPPSRRFPRIRFNGWRPGRPLLGTLGSRLLAGVVAVVLIVVVATGVATFLTLRSYLMGRLDKQLASTATPRQVQQLLIPTTRPYFAAGPSPQKVYVAVLQTNGTPVPTTVTSQMAVAVSLPTSIGPSLVAHPGRHETVTADDGTELRVVALPSTSYGVTVNGVGSVQNLVVVFGLSTGEINRTMSRLVVLELVIGAGAVLIAFGFTAWGVRVSLGPLKRVTRTAQEVTAELSPEGAGLDRRVPESSATTEVGQLAHSFNTMLDTVETEFRARRDSEERMRQFLADASHELRTPLTSIRGYAELARMQKARDGTFTDDDTLGRIESEGTRMSRLVEDLLILARGDDPSNADSLDRSAIDIGDLIGDVVSGVRAANPQRQVVAQVDPGLTLFGDRDQILRVLRNLATNAAVHTDPEGLIRIEGHREGASVVLQVIDQGPGLTPEDAQHVFERFWRADKARTRVRGGSGLGMAIVSQIVETHGGQVYFDSSVENGSTVTVVLPGGAA